MMKRFVVNLLKFFVPLVIAGVFLTVPAIISEEITPLDILIIKQRNSHKERLLGLAYSGSTAYLKLSNTKFYKPDVLALGTSRVMQYKGFYFHKSFYNAGGVGGLTDYIEYIDKLSEDELPELMILGVDEWEFNSEWRGAVLRSNQKTTYTKDNISYPAIVRRVWQDYILGKWKFKTLVQNNNNNLGMNGKVNNNGYMKDGSYYYGEIYENIEKSSDYKFKDTLTRIANGNARFEYGEEIDKDALDDLDEFLNMCHSRGIYVVVFIPPFAPSIIDEMERHGDGKDYLYLRMIENYCRPVVEKYGYEFYDYMDIQELGCEDSYFIDGFHGGEVAYAMILKDMVDKNSRLTEYIDYDRLITLINTKESDLLLKSN